MKRLGLTLGLLLTLGALRADDVPNAGTAFQGLLAESELQLQAPAGYVEVPPRANSVFLYEHALRSADGVLEIRYAVRPLQRLRIDYDDPHGAAPDPNHIFPLVFESLATRLSAGTHTPTQEYPPAQAAEKFNADWAAAAVFDVNPEFGARYAQGLLLALHRNRVADAYVIFLFDDYEAAKVGLQDVMGSLSFVPAATAATAAP